MLNYTQELHYWASLSDKEKVKNDSREEMKSFIVLTVSSTKMLALR